MTSKTISDTERREVAERLRSVAREVDRGGFSETIKHVKLAVFEDLDRYRPNGTLDRLADLIEPGEPKVRCVAEVKVDGERLEELVHDAAVELTGIDRDALLRLSDEIYDTSCDNHGELTVDLIDIWGWAQAICESLGVES